MKKIAILIAMLTLFVMLGAQTGLFELSYGDDSQSCEELMSEKGFYLDYDGGDVQTYYPDDNEYVDSIELQYDPYDDALIGWVVYYLPQDEEDIEEEIVDILVDWHGDDYDYYDEDGMYSWELDDNHTVEAYWDWSTDLFCVDYY